MSTEPHPEVNVDESGIGPQQDRGPDWPKKIRTLTATELDRLTIDSAGRFYWDGKLVNYQPPDTPRPAADKTEEPQAQPPAGLIDHDPYSFEQPKPAEHAEHVETAEVERTDDAPIHPVAHRDDRFHDLDDVHTVQHHAVHHHDMTAEITGAYAAPTIQMPDRIRLSMTWWQSLGALIVVLCLMIGTLGIAAFGFIAAHDWGCRTGLIQSHCPAPAGRPPARTDIPA